MEEPDDDTWVDRTWMAYSRTILIALAVGALLVRGAYLRGLPLWICFLVAIPAVALAAGMLARMQRLSRRLLDTRRSSLIAMCTLVSLCAIAGAAIATIG